MTVAAPRFHHVSLQVSSAASSIDFYRRAFGFVEQLVLFKPDGRRVVHLAAPGGNVLLELIEGDEPPADAVHLGFSCGDIDRAILDARAAGVEIARGPLRVGSEQVVFLRDPDGYLVELNDGLVHARPGLVRRR